MKRYSLILMFCMAVSLHAMHPKEVSKKSHALIKVGQYVAVRYEYPEVYTYDIVQENIPSLPFLIAVQNNNGEAIKQWITKGGSPNIPLLVMPPFQEEWRAISPLHYLLEQHNTRGMQPEEPSFTVFKTLIRNGAVDDLDYKNNELPLIELANLYGLPSFVKEILQSSHEPVSLPSIEEALSWDCYRTTLKRVIKRVIGYIPHTARAEKFKVLCESLRFKNKPSTKTLLVCHNQFECLLEPQKYMRMTITDDLTWLARNRESHMVLVRYYKIRSLLARVTGHTLPETICHRIAVLAAL